MSPSTPPLRRDFPSINGIRAIGALFVLTTHVGFHSGASLNSTFNGVLSRLDAGVAIFFVISGFLLFRPHTIAWLRGTRGPDTKRYLWHRVLRIMPALWLAVLGASLLLNQTDTSFGTYLRHATLTQIYTPGNEAQGLTQMWSLATEVAFYIVLPLIAWVLTRGRPDRRGVHRRLALLCTLPVVGAGWMALSAAHPGVRALWLPGYVGWFGLGMALALWQAARSVGVLEKTWIDDLVPQPWSLWGLALALYLVLVSPIAGPYSLAQATTGEAAVKSFLYGVFALLVVFPAAAGPSTPEDTDAVRLLGGRAWTFMGNISYGIFCYHLIVLGVLEQIVGYTIFTGGFFTLLLSTLAGTVVVASGSYYLVERPIMRRGRRAESPGGSGRGRPPAVSRATATATRIST
ncbi:MAG: acyltransferase [Ornithinibacter sp.]